MRTVEQAVEGTKTVGSVTFLAIMSLAIIKIFCELALADEKIAPARITDSINVSEVVTE